MRILWSIGLLLLTLSGLAQEEFLILPATYRVTSLNGLNMRMNPHIESVILMAIPYAEEVEVLENKSYGEFTQGQHQMYGFDNISYDISVTGHWVKVAYQGKQGFVFSPYLIYATPPREHIAGINEDYLLLF